MEGAEVLALAAGCCGRTVRNIIAWLETNGYIARQVPGAVDAFIKSVFGR